MSEQSKHPQSELSEADLDQVAGGGGVKDSVSSAVGSAANAIGAGVKNAVDTASAVGHAVVDAATTAVNNALK